MGEGEPEESAHFFLLRLSGDAVRARAGKPDMAITWGYGDIPRSSFCFAVQPRRRPLTLRQERGDLGERERRP